MDIVDVIARASKAEPGLQFRVFTDGFTNQIAAAQTLATAVNVDEFGESTMSFTNPAVIPAGTVRFVLENFAPAGNTSSCDFDAVRFGYDYAQAATPTDAYTDDSLLGREAISGTIFSAPSVTDRWHCLMNTIPNSAVASAMDLHGKPF